MLFQFVSRGIEAIWVTKIVTWSKSIHSYILICKNFLNDEYFRLIDKKRPNYILSYYNARSSGDKLDLHIDSHLPYLGKKIFMMQFSIVLEDQNKENGCTIIVPNSHKSGRFSNRK